MLELYPHLFTLAAFLTFPTGVRFAPISFLAVVVRLDASECQVEKNIAHRLALKELKNPTRQCAFFGLVLFWTQTSCVCGNKPRRETFQKKKNNALLRASRRVWQEALFPTPRSCAV